MSTPAHAPATSRRPSTADARFRFASPGTRRRHADHRQPLRHDRLRPPARARRVRAAGPLRGGRRRHRGAAATPPSCAARRRTRATTWSSPSAATAPSTKPPTDWLGSPTPLCCLPGGSANVFGKMLGIPGELVDATEHLLAMADDWRPRKVDSASSTGAASPSPRASAWTPASSSASTPTRSMKARLRALLLHWVARHDVPAPLPAHPAAAAGAGRRRRRRSTASRRSSRTARRSPTSRTVRSRSPTAPRSTPARWPAACCIARRLLSTCRRSPGARSRAARASRGHRQVDRLRELTELTVRSADGRPLPLQVDGDYLGEVDRGALLDPARRA